MSDYFDRLVERTSATAETVAPVRRLEPADLAGPQGVEGDEDTFGSTDWVASDDESAEPDGARVRERTDPRPVLPPRHDDPGVRDPDTAPAAAGTVEPSVAGDQPSAFPLADGQHRAAAPAVEPGSHEPAHLGEFIPVPSPSRESAHERPAGGPAAHPADGEAVSAVPGLAEMDRVLFGQAGLTPPWEQPSDAEPDDLHTEANQAPITSHLEFPPEERDLERQDPAPFVEHVPSSAPEPPSAPAPHEPTVSIGSIRIEILEPPVDPQQPARGVPRARAHLGPSRTSRPTWGW